MSKSLAVHIQVVDPPAYTPPYDHALCTALAEEGCAVELVTSPFTYAQQLPAENYTVNHAFYRRAHSGGGLRQLSRFAQHVPDMLRYARGDAQRADLVHFQWLTVQQIDATLLPKNRPLVLTAHDILPREPRPGQHWGQRRLYDRMDAVVTHSEHGAQRLHQEAGVSPDRVHVIPHGVFHHLTEHPQDASLPPELPATDGPVVLMFGLLRPYKGLDLMVEAWRSIATAVPGASLWIVGMPRMEIAELQLKSEGLDVSWVPRYVAGSQLAATFRRADVVVLPYREIDQSGVLFTSLAFEKPVVLSDVGGFPETAETGVAELFPSGDSDALAHTVSELLLNTARREEMARAAAEVSRDDGPLSWGSIAKQTVELYENLLGRSVAGEARATIQSSA